MKVLCRRVFHGAEEGEGRDEGINDDDDDGKGKFSLVIEVGKG